MLMTACFMKGSVFKTERLTIQKIQNSQDSLRNAYKESFTVLTLILKRRIVTISLTFMLNYLPNGLIGLLLAVISAAMSSTAGELNALGNHNN